MNEVISGVRVIKMYAWEEPFAALVDEVRRLVRLLSCSSKLLQECLLTKGRNLERIPKIENRVFLSFLFDRLEISKILRSSYLRGLNMASFFVASKIIIFVTVCVFVLTGNQLSASTVFLAISLYGAVRLTITLFFPFAIEKLSECLISIRRIQVGAPWSSRCRQPKCIGCCDLYLPNAFPELPPAG